MSPTPRLLLLLAGPAVLAALTVGVPALRPWMLLADAVLIGLALLDLITLPRRSQLEVTRRGSTVLSVGTPNALSLVIRTTGRLPRQIHVTESVPQSLAADGLPARAWLPPRGRVELPYRLTPHRRGAVTLGRTYVVAHSLLGLWRRHLRLALPSSALKVFPDIKLLNTYALLARRNRIDLLGFRKARGRGSDVEFDRLRDYQPDDDYRRIDPFASARHRRLITREYEVSRNQNVFFIIDCGRPMAAESEGLSSLDHALNAAVMLSVISLEAGDNVGLMAFDQRVRTFLPFSSGLRSKTAVLNAVYDLKVSPEEPNYEEAMMTLQRRVRQRSLVVVLTNLMDRASFDMLRPHIKMLSRRHLPLVVLLRDADLFDLAERPPSDTEEFYVLGAAAELASRREQMARDLQRQGTLVLDLIPAQVTAELINTYLRIKADQLL